MKKLLPFLIVLLGGFLRFWQYEYFPVGGETADEGAWTMLGASLIQDHVPASWSYFAAYERYQVGPSPYGAPVVRPAFDHPPLFALIPGAAQSLRGDWQALPSLKVIRLPMVLLGTVTVWLFWLVAQKIFRTRCWALVTTLLFATAPGIVFGSRLVVAENLLSPLILLMLLILVSHPLPRARTWLTTIACAAVLTKMTGLVVPITLVLAGGLFRRREYVEAGIRGAVLGAAIFMAYGALYNWPLFTAVFAAQADREIGFATLTNRLLLHPTLVKHAFLDGWKIVGLLATFVGLQAAHRHWKLVSLITSVGLLFIAVSSGEHTLHGWYDYALWPTLMLSTGALLQTWYEKKNGLGLLLTWLFVLPAVRLGLLATDVLERLSALAVRGVIGVGTLPLLGETLRFKKLFVVSSWLLLLILVVCNCLPVFFFTHTAYWEQASLFELW